MPEPVASLAEWLNIPLAEWLAWLPDWAKSQTLWTAVFIASVALAVVSALAVPWLLVRIPADYFAGEKRPRASTHLSFFLRVLRNLAGVVLLLLGLLMLVLPGQGLLTMVVGLLFLDFPGKYRLLRRLLRTPSLRAFIARVRARAGRAPLELDEPS